MARERLQHGSVKTWLGFFYAVWQLKSVVAVCSRAPEASQYCSPMDVNVNLAVFEDVFHGRLVEEEDWARLVAEGMRL